MYLNAALRETCHFLFKYIYRIKDVNKMISGLYTVYRTMD